MRTRRRRWGNWLGRKGHPCPSPTCTPATCQTSAPYALVKLVAAMRGLFARGPAFAFHGDVNDSPSIAFHTRAPAPKEKP